jgi:hypothetical protein
MNPEEVAAGSSKLVDLEPRQGKGSASGPGGIEIAGFPQTLYTRTFGDPDMLFVPLLDATREAYAMVERLCSHGETKGNAVMMSGMHLASSFLHDSNFSLVAKGLTHEHVYTVDLAAGTLRVNTRLYASMSRRTSLFKVELLGNISGGPFAVRNSVQDFVIMQVEEERLRQPSFSFSSLGQECLRAQMEHERFGRMDEALGPAANSDMRFTLTVAGNKVPVTLRQKEKDGQWDIIDGRLQEWVGTLTPKVQEHLRSVTTFLEVLFAQK